jgi:hypothetical protein
MIKNISLLGLILTFSAYSYGYICTTTVLKNPQGAKIVLFGDLHLSNCNLAQKQTELVCKKLKALGNQGHKTKIWYEAHLAEKHAACFGPQDFLHTLKQASEQQNLGFKNIDNRTFLSELSCLEPKILYGDDLKHAIEGYQKELNRLKPGLKKHKSVYCECKGRLKHLKYAQTLPPKAQLVKTLKQKITTIQSTLENKLKELRAQGKLSKKLAKALLEKFSEGKSLCNEAFKLLTPRRSRPMDPEAIDMLTVGTALYLDANFIFEYLEDPRSKHVLFAGTAHVSSISELLQADDFTIVYQSGFCHEELSETEENSLHAQQQEPKPVSRKDFDFIRA